MLPAPGNEDDPSDRKEIEATEDAQCGTTHSGELKRRRGKRRRQKRERRLVREGEPRRGVPLVRVHAANYERSEGAKQCVVFHPQVPPNNIRRNFFFFFSFLGFPFFYCPVCSSSTLFFRQKYVRNCWEFHFSPYCKFNSFLIIIEKIGQSVVGKITKLKQKFEQAGFFFQFCDLKNLSKLVKFTQSHFFSPPTPQKKEKQQKILN